MKQTGAALLEYLLAVSILMMVCMVTVGKLGYNTGKQFCKPVQSIADDGSVAPGVTAQGLCKWEEGGMTEKFKVNRMF